MALFEVRRKSLITERWLLSWGLQDRQQVNGGCGEPRTAGQDGVQKCGQAAAVCGTCLCNFTLWDSGWEFTESETPLCSVPRALWEA